MKKAVWFLLGLVALRLLPKALRREALMVELAGLVLSMASMASTNTSKAVSTEQRTSALENRTGVMQSQQGTTSPASNLSQTETGSAQPLGGDVESGIPNNNDTSTPYGATVSGSSVASHYHGMQNHTHNYEHFHYNQVQGDFDNLVTVVNQMRNALITAQIL